MKTRYAKFAIGMIFVVRYIKNYDGMPEFVRFENAEFERDESPCLGV